MSKRSKISLVILLILLVIIIVSGSYAFYNARLTKNGSNSVTVTSKKLGIEFVDGPVIELSGVLPGQKLIKTFTVKNTGSITETYHLDFKDVTNNFSRTNDLVYTLTSTNDGATLTETIFPTDDETFASNITIDPNVTQEYTLTVEYKNLDLDQSIDMNKLASATIQVTQVIKSNTRGTSILDILEKKSNLTTGYYDFEVIGDDETVTYPVHLIVLDGNQTITTNTTYGDENDVGSANGMAANMVIVKVNGDYTINQNVTVSPYYDATYGGPKGFMLYVTGKLTNNGTIDQSHGAYATGDNVYLWKNANNTFEVVPATGALGVASGDTGAHDGVAGLDGSTAGKRALASGGTGISDNNGHAGDSGDATSYSGGSGSGSAFNCTSEDATDNGGKGGDSCGAEGGGAGNPGGAGGGLYPAGDNGTGGLLIIKAGSYENNGLIKANGSNGGLYSPKSGGSSGGGSVNIFVDSITGTNYMNILGSVNVSGGFIQGTKFSGGKGGTGTINIGTFVNGSYRDLADYIDDAIYATTYSGDSIIDIISDHTNMTTGYYKFTVNASTPVTYHVHLIKISGNQTITSDVTYGDSDDVASGSESYEMAKNMIVVLVDGDYTVNQNVTVSPYYDNQYGGPKGFLLYVTGTLINNGTIDNSHGAYAAGEDVYLWKNTNNSYEMVPSEGALGGAGAYHAVGKPGDAGNTKTSRALAGGGAGGGYNATGGAGGTATSYSGGTGGGAAGRANGEAGSNNGGKGGDAIASNTSQYGGGGAGNPGGVHTYGTSYNGENGTGGLLIIYANTFNNLNEITALGSDGGEGADSGGGASGGGSINIFSNSITNIGSLTTTGGSTTGAKAGGAGGNGTANIGTIVNGNYVSAN